MAASLVGREPVLATARAALDECLAGTGQLLLISGEPGIGKTAVMAELAGEAATRGARVLRGSCWDGGAPAYWPWVQVLRAADLSESLDNADSGARPAEARLQLLDGVTEALIRLAAAGPLVIALDDLQWADEPSLQLLEYVARRISSVPLLLVGAYREAEAGPALRSAVAGGHQLPLPGLPAADVRDLMAAVTGVVAPPALAEQVWRRSGGNPFFVRELARLVAARGGWGAAEAAGSSIPDTVRDTLERRLARISQPCVEMLTVAAVAGAEVREELLDRLPPSDPAATLADLLAEAVAARVLVEPEQPAGRHRFSHDLYREALLAGVPPSRRRSLHLAVGRELQAMRAAGADVHAAEVALHLLASGAPEAGPDAVRCSAEAAYEAMARLGYEDAAQHYERALAAWERMERGDPADRLELLFGLADARARSGDGTGARAVLHRAVDLTQRTADAGGLARAAVALHDLGARGVGPEATATTTLLEAAAARLPADPPSALRARVLTALVRSMRHQAVSVGQARIVVAAEEAVSVARAAADPFALASALLALHDAHWQPGTGPIRLAVLDEMRSAATAAGTRDLVAQTHQLRAAALLESGDPAGRTELGRYVELMATSGHARGRWEAMTRRATLAAIAGRFAEADRLATEAVEFGRAIGEPDAEGVHGTLRGSLLSFGAASGGWGVSAAELERAAPVRSYLPVLRAVPLIAGGDLATARELLTGFAADDIAATHDLEPLALLAVVFAAVGPDDQQRRVYGRLAPHAGLHVVVGGCASYWGAVDHHLGLLSAGFGDTRAAIGHLESARAAYQRLGAPAWAELCTGVLARLSTGKPVFRFDGGSWELAYLGTRVHLPDAKGLRDLATLVAAPGMPVHVLDLVGSEERLGADPVLDEQARSAYRRRLADLDAEIDEAQEWQDRARADRAVIEREALIRELTAAAGLGGRSRRLGDVTERARKTVTARIRDALGKVERAHPALGEHLRATVTTGTSCAYTPGRELVQERESASP
jgi:tetratricopeptide (TPR) repeat protein